MRAIIVIECDEDNEVIQHLNVLTKDLKKQIIKRRKENPEDVTDLKSYDDNCYGSHQATVHFDDSFAIELPFQYVP